MMRFWLDLFFDRFQWYRKRIGGIWYNTLDLPFGPGPYNVWWHNKRPACTHFLLQVEDYDSQ